MIKKREQACMSVKDMARLCQCSELLLGNLECFGWVTHPHIASRIAYVYDLDLDQFNDLVPAFRRLATLPDPIAPPTSNDYQEARCSDDIPDFGETYVEEVLNIEQSTKKTEG